MTPLQKTRLEKAAADRGFELTPVEVDGGLVLRSAQFSESVTVFLNGDGFCLKASTVGLLPADNPDSTSLEVRDYVGPYHAIDIAVAIARSWPTRLADRVARETASLPRATEAERLIVQRVGQALFRNALASYWGGKCCVSGLSVEPLLRFPLQAMG